MIHPETSQAICRTTKLLERNFEPVYRLQAVRYSPALWGVGGERYKSGVRVWIVTSGDDSRREAWHAGPPIGFCLSLCGRPSVQWSIGLEEDLVEAINELIDQESPFMRRSGRVLSLPI